MIFLNKYTFQIVSDAGQVFNIDCDDVVFNYAAYRNVLPEDTCLSFIDTIKSKSGKKLAIIYGNCQTMKLRDFFLNNAEFSETYITLVIPAVCDYGRNFSLFQENFWSFCDLLISQRVNKDNRFNPLLATQKLPLLIPEHAKIIWIPNVYFDGYFPQRTKNLRNVDIDKHQSGRFPTGDKYVDEFLQGGGRTISELVKYIEAQNFISEDEIKSKVDESFEELRKREWACDIHMLDFVVNNYQSYQIFYAPNHPAQEVIWELARRILNFIDIKNLTFQNIELLLNPRASLKGQDIPIYPAVANILNLKKIDSNFVANNCLWNFSGNYIEFLIEYAKWCWRDKLIMS